MKTSLLKLTLRGGCLMAASLTALGGPLQRADVPAEPAWVLHLDCDGLRPTAIGQYLLAEMNKPEAQAKLAAFQSIFSFDLRTQLHGLTLYDAGNSPDDGVLLVYADFDPDRLVTLAKAAKDSQSSTHNQHVIYNWIDEKKHARNGVKPRTYAAIFANRLVIFGQREVPVAAALDVLGGTAPNLSASKVFADLGGAGKRGVLQGAARKLDLSDSDPNAAIFRLSKLIRLEVGEAQQQVTARLTLEANDGEVAGHIAAIAQGLLALAKLQKEKPEAVKLAEAITLQQTGASVNARLSLPADTVIEMMKAGAARKAAKKAPSN